MEAPSIIDTSAFLEGRRGLLTVFTLIEHPYSAKQGVSVIYPSKADYLKAIEVSDKLYHEGTPVGAVDVLIASIALNRDLSVVTQDKDFEKINAVERKLKIEFI